MAYQPEHEPPPLARGRRSGLKRRPRITGDAEHAAVEKLVVEAVQAQPVVDGVRSIECPPTDVRGIEPDRLGPEPPAYPHIAHRYS